MQSLLLKKDFLVLDCQTTGLHPSQSHLVEMAWTVWCKNSNEYSITNHVVQLPPGFSVPPNIQKIIGLNDEDLQKGITISGLFSKFQEVLSSLHPNPVLIIHYASFEKKFLQHFYRNQASSEVLPFDTLCTHKLARKIYPNLPSLTLKGIAGYFGIQLGEFKRASSNVIATCKLAEKIFDHLHAIGIYDFSELTGWMQNKSVATPKKYLYQVTSEKRLSLSTSPGIYKMLGQNGEVLYVGKATSLRSRVNSYFRGQKNRDKKKLEMLSQVRDIDVIECDTPLEAALLELDEIQKILPPYNILLKNIYRQLIYYSRDLQSCSDRKDETHCIGPFRLFDAMENLCVFYEWIRDNDRPLFFDDEISKEILREGFTAFLSKHNYPLDKSKNISARQWLLLGTRLLRTFEKNNNKADFEKEWRKFKKQLTLGKGDDEIDAILKLPDSVAGKFERILIRAALAKRRIRQMNRLLNAKILVKHKGIEKVLVIRNGSPSNEIAVNWDRMSILLSEIKKHAYKIIF